MDSLVHSFSGQETMMYHNAYNEIHVPHLHLGSSVRPRAFIKKAESGSKVFLLRRETYRPVREKNVLRIHTWENVKPKMARHSKIEYQNIRASVDFTVEWLR